MVEEVFLSSWLVPPTEIDVQHCTELYMILPIGTNAHTLTTSTNIMLLRVPRSDSYDCLVSIIFSVFTSEAKCLPLYEHVLHGRLKYGARLNVSYVSADLRRSDQNIRKYQGFSRAMTQTRGSDQEGFEISWVGFGRVWSGGFHITTDRILLPLPDPTWHDMTREIDPSREKPCYPYSSTNTKLTASTSAD